MASHTTLSLRSTKTFNIGEVVAKIPCAMIQFSPSDNLSGSHLVYVKGMFYNLKKHPVFRNLRCCIGEESANLSPVLRGSNLYLVASQAIALGSVFFAELGGRLKYTQTLKAEFLISARKDLQRYDSHKKYRLSDFDNSELLEVVDGGKYRLKPLWPVWASIRTNIRFLAFRSSVVTGEGEGKEEDEFSEKTSCEEEEEEGVQDVIYVGRDLYVAKSKIVGANLGLFTASPRKAGELVCRFEGKVIPPLLSGEPGEKLSEIEERYSYTVRGGVIINPLVKTKTGFRVRPKSFAAYINEPPINTFSNVMAVDDVGGKSLSIFAVCDIPENEELYMLYSSVLGEKEQLYQRDYDFGWGAKNRIDDFDWE
jgi:hypothetical protein